MILKQIPDKPLYDLLLLAVIAALLFGVGLGTRPYSAPSEARYVEIGREMAESGDYVTPRLDYVKYFEKPPLFYWVQAEATRHLGLNPFAARLPTMGFAVLLCLVTYGLGRTVDGRAAGWFSALILATSLYLFSLSRVVLLDVPVSLFIVTTLTAFLYIADAPDSRKRTLALYGMYAAAALAVLAKGLIGAVLPGAIIFLWLGFTGRWSLLARIRIVPGTILFLLIAVPWHVLVAARNPEFLHFYFIHEHFQRYTSKIHGRYQPVWFFAAVLLAGLFPWVAFAWQAFRQSLKGAWQRRRESGTPLYLLVWILFIFVFFSLSDSKLIPYILPIFPPIAVFIGRYFAAGWRENHAPKGFGTGLIVSIALLAAIAVGPSVVLEFVGPESKIAIGLTQGGNEAHHLSIAAIVLAGLLLIVHVQFRTRHLLVALLLSSVVILQMGDAVAAHYDRDSMQAIAETIREVESGLHETGEVATFENYYQDLPVYLTRRITIVNWKGELEFGAAHEDTSAWITDDKTFWQRWMKNDHLMFAVMRDEAFGRLVQGTTPEARHLYVLNSDDRNVVVANRAPEPPKAPGAKGAKP